jgi:hypothetical protein
VGWLTRHIAATLLAAFPLSAASQTLADLETCRTVRPDLQAYVSEFSADGWTPASQSIREWAGRATLEVWFAAHRLPKAFQAEKDQATFLSFALSEASSLPEGIPLLVRGDAALLMFFVPAGNERAFLVCILASERLQPVEDRKDELSYDGRVRGIATAIPKENSQIPNYEVKVVRLDFPFITDPAPTGKDGLISQLEFRLAKEEE